MCPLSETTCPFCGLAPERIVFSDDGVMALFDAYPVTPGHTLVVPTQHVSRLFDLPPDEQLKIWLFTGRVRRFLAERLTVDSFNIGINDGEAAGQTVGHAHIHIIPRRLGDLPDPRGGIRWIIPKKADYWTRR